ncbi:hypothetical protein [Riemerella columbina]|uniref:hypothetical protein n=1 Tax=Riemerella columbina TaxID=103810 RepID=UPI0026707EF1|nr:hypothetical protein [Riemerella columbina]WKS95031.1 hypothetical protein NYR17_08905 [Riemerella columbina]
MKINDCILEALKAQGRVDIPYFGYFQLKDAGAVLNPEDGSILPPAKQVVFVKAPVETSDFVAQVAHYKAIALEKAQFEVETQIDYWNKKLEAGEAFSIEHLGRFEEASEEPLFIGERVHTEDTPDFYGLEAIHISDITAKAQDSTPQKKAKPSVGKVLLWLLVLGIIAAGLVYLAVEQPELIFGAVSQLQQK